MKVLFLFCLLATCMFGFGQNSEKEKTGKVANQKANKGKISGIVTDASNGQRIPFASISILKAIDSSLAGGGISNDNGEFEIERVAPGQYLAKISFLGYNHLFSKPFVISGSEEIKLGNNKLEQAGKLLKEVQVQGERPFMKLDIDKKTYLAEKMIVAQSGSASDLLQQIPSVSVDMDGNISLRGSGSINVLIDGKPSGITGNNRQAILDQIPANTIESVEVITNPSARYDPDGAAGIINIILKKNRRDGSNGNIQAGTGTRDKYNLGLTANRKTGRWSYNFNYALRLNHRWSDGWNWRDTFLKNSVSGHDSAFYLTQTTAGGTQSNTNQARLGLDYVISRRDKISTSALVLLTNNWRNERVYYDFFDNTRTLSSQLTRYGASNSIGKQFDYRLGYSRSFNRQGKDFSASVNYTTNRNSDAAGYQTSNSGNNQLGFSPGQQTATEGFYSVLTSQLDYVVPIGKSGKFEAGAKAIDRYISNDYRSESLKNDGKYANDDSISNVVIMNEQIQSGYVQYGGNAGAYRYQAGLRAEITPYRVNQQTTGQSYSRTLYNYFPSFALSGKLNAKNEIQLSYSRRIDRPGLQMLNPFPDYADPVNLRIGNPKLLPEYISSYELSDNYSSERLTVVTTAFYRSSTNTVNRIRAVGEDGRGTITMQNIASNISYGGELIVRNDLAKWLNLNSSGNISNNQLQGNTTVGDLKRTNWTWMVKSQANIKPTRGTDIQISYNYRARNINVQGQVGPFTNLDFALKQEIWQGKANISLNVTDVFNTSQFHLINYGYNFNAEAIRKMESRVALLTFTYRFGSGQNDAPKKGRGAGEENGPTGGGGGEM